MYQPLRAFFLIGSVFIVAGIIPAARFLILRYLLGQGSGNIQSLILSAVLLIVGVQIYLIGLLADLIAFNRKMLEDQNYRLKRLELERTPPNQKLDRPDLVFLLAASVFNRSHPPAG